MPFNVTHMATASNMAMLTGNTTPMSATEPKTKTSSSSSGGSGKKPVITISAPPSVADSDPRDRDMYNAPRTAPVPPPAARSSSRTAREKDHGATSKKSLGFGFAKKDKSGDESVVSDRPSREKQKDKQRSLDREKPQKELPSPTPSLSPMLPTRMQFPIPPSSKVSRLAAHCSDTPERTLGTGAQVVPTLTDAFQSVSPTPSSLATASPHTATPSDPGDGSPTFPSRGLGVPSRPLRPTSLIIPGSGSPRPRANSANTLRITATSNSIHALNQPPSSPSNSNSSPTSTGGRPLFPPSSRLRAHRVSRSPSPASPPPRSPLPSPPISTTSFPLSSDAEPEGWSTDASTRLGHGGWSTDASASTRVGSVSAGVMRKASLLGGRESGRERIRANTITNVGGPGAMRYGYGAGVRYGHVSGVSSGEETREESRSLGGSMRVRVASGAGRSGSVAGALPAFVSKEKERKDKPRAEMPVPVPQLQAQPRPSSPTAPSQRSDSQDRSHASTPTRPSTTASTEDQTPALRAAHDTFVRILQEKHAAEKTELLRRIERLERDARKREREIRGLRWLVMNATGNGTGDASLLALDEQLATGRLRSGSKSSEISDELSSGSCVRAHASPEFTEELIELQSAVSDLIAPASSQSQVYTDRPDSFGAGSGAAGADLRRSRTMQEYAGPTSGGQHKQVRRTSSPVLPSIPSSGLGFDIPSIPGSSSDMSLATLALGESIPSLTGTNTASSTSMSSGSLSAIPEIISLSSSSVRDVQRERERERVEKEERRASRALKRISASSSSSSTNVKGGVPMSPSIGQVLDRSRELDVDDSEAGMDEVLRKLRAFGGGGGERDG